MHKTGSPVWVGYRSIRENFDETVSCYVQIYQHKGSIFIMQSKCFLQSKFGIKGKRVFQIVSSKCNVTKISDQS